MKRRHHEEVRSYSRVGQHSGRTSPSLSIEITKECPLRCPGCYAFDDAHLGGTTRLRELSDYRGGDLVARVLELIDEMRPLHVSSVGGDPTGTVLGIALRPEAASRVVGVPTLATLDLLWRASERPTARRRSPRHESVRSHVENSKSNSADSPLV